jgi:hypothetical protein
VNIMGWITGADRAAAEASSSTAHVPGDLTFDPRRGWVDQGAEEQEAMRVAALLECRERQQRSTCEERSADLAERDASDAAREAARDATLPAHLRRQA